MFMSMGSNTGVSSPPIGESPCWREVVITHTVEGNKELDNDIMEMKIASSTLSPKSIINMLS